MGNPHNLKIAGQDNVEQFNLNDILLPTDPHTGRKPNIFLIIDNTRTSNQVTDSDGLILTKKIANILNIQTKIIFHHDIRNYSELNPTFFGAYDSQKIAEIVAKQREDNSNPVLFIFDKCCDFNTISRDYNLNEILLNGRHLKTYCIFLVDHPYNFTPSIRTNFDFIFAFKEDIINNVKKLFNNYFGILPVLKQYRDLNNDLQQHECLVMINCTNSYYLKDKLKYYEV